MKILREIGIAVGVIVFFAVAQAAIIASIPRGNQPTQGQSVSTATPSMMQNAAPQEFQPHRATAVIRGCVHFIPHVGVYNATPDYCVTGMAYLYYVTPTATYIETFNTGQGQPVLFNEAPYPGTATDESGFESWTFQ